MPQNCELTWIVEELSSAGNFLHFLLPIGLGPDLVCCQLRWILANGPCPRILNFGSIGLEYIYIYIYFNKLPCWYWSLAKFGILYSISLLGKMEGRRRRGWQRMRWLEWHHQITGHEFRWTPGGGDGQGGLACCSSWDHKESDMTEQLNWIDPIPQGLFFSIP